ncbi:MAG: DNA-processing protein DprA [Myxococcota bacterium]
MVDVRRLPSAFGRRDPPLVLFVRGDVGLLERDAVGIVGSRRASRDAAAWAEELAAQQAQRGVLIVSGSA